MAHSGIFATKTECDSKAGVSVSSVGWSEANINQWCSEAESYINVLCGYNFSDNYATLNVDVKKILTEACSNLVAVYGISYDIGCYSEEEKVSDVLSNLNLRFTACINLLKDASSVEYIKGVAV